MNILIMKLSKVTKKSLLILMMLVFYACILLISSILINRLSLDDVKDRLMKGDVENLLTKKQGEYKQDEILYKKNDGYVNPYLSNVKNQGPCGSCWAHALASSMADSYNMQSKARSIELSPKFMMEKRKEKPDICNGESTFRYMNHYLTKQAGGTVMEKHEPYWNFTNRKKFHLVLITIILMISVLLGLVALNKVMTWSSLLFMVIILGMNISTLYFDKEMRKQKEYRTMEKNKNVQEKENYNNTFYADSRYYVDEIVVNTYEGDMNQLIEKIKGQIRENGSVVARMKIFKSFPKGLGKHGIYDSRKGTKEMHVHHGNHAVEIVGWGETYWICRNSWGRLWGEMTKPGYWYHAMGIPWDEGGIEEKTATFKCYKK